LITQKALDDFKVIWKEVYGEEISDEFALQHAFVLLNFTNLIYRPLKKEWVEKEKINGP